MSFRESCIYKRGVAASEWDADSELTLTHRGLEMTKVPSHEDSDKIWGNLYGSTKGLAEMTGTKTKALMRHYIWHKYPRTSTGCPVVHSRKLYEEWETFKGRQDEAAIMQILKNQIIATADNKDRTGKKWRPTQYETERGDTLYDTRGSLLRIILPMELDLYTSDHNAKSDREKLRKRSDNKFIDANERRKGKIMKVNNIMEQILKEALGVTDKVKEKEDSNELKLGNNSTTAQQEETSWDHKFNALTTEAKEKDEELAEMLTEEERKNFDFVWGTTWRDDIEEKEAKERGFLTTQARSIIIWTMLKHGAEMGLDNYVQQLTRLTTASKKDLQSAGITANVNGNSWKSSFTTILTKVMEANLKEPIHTQIRRIARIVITWKGGFIVKHPTMGNSKLTSDAARLHDQTTTSKAGITDYEPYVANTIRRMKLMAPSTL